MGSEGFTDGSSDITPTNQLQPTVPKCGAPVKAPCLANAMSVSVSGDAVISEDSAIEWERSGAEVQSHFSRHESNAAGKKATEQPQCDSDSGKGSVFTEDINGALEREKETYPQERIRTTSFKISAKERTGE
jgi:hypothetical protein